MAEKLMPCPWCGGEPTYYKDCGVWSLDCDLCDVTGPRSETKEGAAIAWNNRKKTEVEE